MSRFELSKTPLAGLKIVTRRMMGDHRGFLARLFCMSELGAAGWDKPVVQINHSYTAGCGTVRGLHLQMPPHGEMKLVSCLRGEVWDVAVDVRQGSSTFLKWHGVRLSRENGRALLIPEGFAHGFQTLTNDVELLYCHSASYMPLAERGFNPLDPLLHISWPLEITRMSDRDQAHAMISEAFKGV